jgi:hypothetical protein
MIKSILEYFHTSNGPQLNDKDLILGSISILSFNTKSRPLIGTIQHPIREVLRALSQRVKLPQHEADQLFTSFCTFCK